MFLSFSANILHVAAGNQQVLLEFTLPWISFFFMNWNKYASTQSLNTVLTLRGADYMANFSPGWMYSLALSKPRETTVRLSERGGGSALKPKKTLETRLDVIYQKRVRVFHQEFQTPRNKWKHVAAGRVLLLFRGVWNPSWNTKHEFLVQLLKRVVDYYCL